MAHRVLALVLVPLLAACAGGQTREDEPTDASGQDAQVADTGVQPTAASDPGVGSEPVMDLSQTRPGGAVVAAGSVEGKGGVYVTTVPAGATVLLNGAAQQGRSPMVIENLPAGQYYVFATTDELGGGQSVAVAPDAFTRVNLTLKALGGRAAIISDPLEVDVYIDDKKVGATPVIASGLSVGDHTVRLIKAGSAEDRFVITIRGTEIQRFVRALKPGGRLIIGANQPGVTVMLNGTAVGQIPIDLPSVPAGSYEATFGDPRFKEQKFTVKVEAGRTNQFSWTLTESKCKLAIETDPPEAKIKVDGADAGKGPKLELEVACGNHEVSAENWRFLTATVTATAAAGETRAVRIKLETDTGSIKASSTPAGAKVVVNGQAEIGITPVNVPKVPAGTYELEFRLDGYQTVSRTVLVKPRQESEVAVSLRKK